MRFLVALLSSLVAAAALGAGLFCALCAVAGWRGSVDPRFDIFTHFAPFWLLGGLAATLTGLFFRTWPLKALVMTPGLVAVIAAGGLIVPEVTRRMSPRAPADAPHQIKLIQFNTWVENADVEGTARWIADQDADVVVIEESTPALVMAIQRLKPGYHRSGLRSSVVIFSKAAQTTNAPPAPRGEGPRAPMARASFGPADGGFTVVGVHYAWPTSPARLQRAQAEDLARSLDALDHSRLILTGDFNSTPWSFARRHEDKMFRLERRTRALASWPARNFTHHRLLAIVPFLPIDHVYAGPDWRTVSVQRGPRLGSDHYPVIVRLALTR